jgi:hypothetical protein
MALLSEAGPQREGVPGTEVLDPVGNGLPRDVQALCHGGKTFSGIEPEQRLDTAEFLGLMGVGSDGFQ